MSDYLEGNQVRVQATFKNSSGQATDPTTVTVAQKQPKAQASYVYGAQGSPVQKASTGVYYIDQFLSAPGRWRFYWHGIGALVAANEIEFEVRPSNVKVS